MKKGFSYIEVLITFLIISLIITASSLSITSIVKTKRRIEFYNEFYYILNKLQELNNEKAIKDYIKNKNIKYQINKKKFCKIIQVTDILSSRKYFIYISNIIHL